MSLVLLRFRDIHDLDNSTITKALIVGQAAGKPWKHAGNHSKGHFLCFRVGTLFGFWNEHAKPLGCTYGICFTFSHRYAAFKIPHEHGGDHLYDILWRSSVIVVWFYLLVLVIADSYAEKERKELINLSYCKRGYSVFSLALGKRKLVQGPISVNFFCPIPRKFSRFLFDPSANLRDCPGG